MATQTEISHTKGNTEHNGIIIIIINNILKPMLCWLYVVQFFTPCLREVVTVLGIIIIIIIITGVVLLLTFLLPPPFVNDMILPTALWLRG
jgi:hypothetical protein